MIIRRQYTGNFTIIGNDIFDDDRLAADEVGVLSYLLSRPHNWEVRRPALMRRWGIGREATRRIIRNLVRYGYCRAERKRTESGTTFMIYEIRDQPGPEITEDEARRALAMDSIAVRHDQIEGDRPEDDPSEDDEPCTGQPSPADPPLADPSPAYIRKQNGDLPKDESTQKPEREGARAREKHVLNLAEFKRRWPTTPSDDQDRVEREWFDLTFDQGQDALAGIVPFLDNQKRLGRKHPPAGFTYLKQKRWTLLAQPDAKPPPDKSVHPRDSAEAQALRALFITAKASAFFHTAVARGAVVAYPIEITPRIAAMAKAPREQDWPKLTRQQAGAWDALIREVLPKIPRKPIVEGDRAPWPWPPAVDGKLYEDVPETPAIAPAEEDFSDFR